MDAELLQANGRAERDAALVMLGPCRVRSASRGRREGLRYRRVRCRVPAHERDSGRRAEHGPTRRHRNRSLLVRAPSPVVVPECVEQLREAAPLVGQSPRTVPSSLSCHKPIFISDPRISAQITSARVSTNASAFFAESFAAGLPCAGQQTEDRGEEKRTHPLRSNMMIAGGIENRCAAINPPAIGARASRVRNASSDHRGFCPPVERGQYSTHSAPLHATSLHSMLRAAGAL